MRASYLQPSSLWYSSFLKEPKQPALILMKNSHFNRTPLYICLGLAKFFKEAAFSVDMIKTGNDTDRRQLALLLIAFEFI